MELLVNLGILGLMSGIFLTLMDRIDEHGLIKGYLKTPLAYLAGFFAAITNISGIEQLPKLSVVLFSLCIYWIIKNKLEYPSHVAFIFCMGIYFGIKFELILNLFPYILVTTGIFFSGKIFFKWIAPKNSNHGKIFHNWYLSKIVEDIIISLILLQPLILVFVVPHAIGALTIKKYFPGTK